VESAATESNAGSLASLIGAESAPQPNTKTSLTVPVEFPGWTFRLNFHLHADDRSA
jgi:hypothetical protein